MRPVDESHWYLKLMVPPVFQVSVWADEVWRSSRHSGRAWLGPEWLKPTNDGNATAREILSKSNSPSTKMFHGGNAVPMPPPQHDARCGWSPIYLSPPLKQY